MCRECSYCEVADTVGQCGYWGFNVMLDDRCHHYTQRDNEARCRVCGSVWDSACPDGCYWVADNMCGECATKELNTALSGWHGLLKDIAKDKEQSAACGRAGARTAGSK